MRWSTASTWEWQKTFGSAYSHLQQERLKKLRNTSQHWQIMSLWKNIEMHLLFSKWLSITRCNSVSCLQPTASQLIHSQLFRSRCISLSKHANISKGMLFLFVSLNFFIFFFSLILGYPVTRYVEVIDLRRKVTLNAKNWKNRILTYSRIDSELNHCLHVLPAVSMVWLQWQSDWLSWQRWAPWQICWTSSMWI